MRGRLRYEVCSRAIRLEAAEAKLATEFVGMTMSPSMLADLSHIFWLEGHDWKKSYSERTRLLRIAHSLARRAKKESLGAKGQKK